MTSISSRLLVPAALAAALAACGGGSNDGDNVAAEADRAGESVVQTPASDAPVATGAAAMLEPTDGNQTRGELRFATVGDRIEVTGTISGLPGNSTHGFHVHETGDCSAPDGTSAGGHFNPASTDHGRVGQGEHHAGDSDNILSLIHISEPTRPY